MTNPNAPDDAMDRMVDPDVDRTGDYGRAPIRSSAGDLDSTHGLANDPDRARVTGGDPDGTTDFDGDDESAFIADPVAAEEATRQRMQEQMALERETGHPVSSDPQEDLDEPVTARAAGMAATTSGDDVSTSDVSGGGSYQRDADAGASFGTSSSGTSSTGTSSTGTSSPGSSSTGSHRADSGTVVNSVGASDPQPTGPDTPSEYPAPGAPDTAPSGVPAPAPAGEPVPDVAPIPGVTPDPGAVPGDPSAPGARSGSGLGSAAGSDLSRP